MKDSLKQIMERFIGGSDTTLRLANQIEFELDDEYPDDDFIHETVVMLAMYRPEGGEFLFESKPVAARLSETIKYLENL